MPKKIVIVREKPTEQKKRNLVIVKEQLEKPKQEISTAAEFAFNRLFDSNGKLNPPEPTAEHLLEIKRQVTGRKNPKNLTDAQLAQVYRILQAELLLDWYNKYCEKKPKRKTLKK